MKIKNVVVAGALALAMGNALAALFDRGGGLIYDDVGNLTWLKDANYVLTSGADQTGKMTWQGAMNWTANLTFYDSVRDVNYSDWRLPTAGNLTTLFYRDLGGHYLSSIYGEHSGGFDQFKNIQNADSYWSATELAQQPDFYAVMFSFQNGTQVGNGKRDREYVWAVRDGDVAFVPPPVIDPPPIVVIDPPIAPIPEPETYAMMLAGLGLLSIARRRRQNLSA